MKHTLKITFVLVFIFFLSQTFGLITINKFIQPARNETTGEIYLEYPETSVGEIPEVGKSPGEKIGALVTMIIAILFVTFLIFFLIRLKIGFLFRYWFLLAILIGLAISLGVYLPSLIAWIIAAVLALWRVFRPNIYIHNLTEILVYAGIAILFVSFFNLITAFILLIVISIYDMIAVWKSKHMVALAKFQTKSKVFAGLLVPYKKIDKSEKLKIPLANQKLKKVEIKTAILGGGDIAFPLIFSSAIMQHLILNKGMDKLAALQSTFIITVFVTIALLILFLKSKKDRFYPAMPFISIGCLAGYIALRLLELII